MHNILLFLGEKMSSFGAVIGSITMIFIIFLTILICHILELKAIQKKLLNEYDQENHQLEQKIVKEKEIVKDTQERYKLIVDTCNDGIWDYDIKKKYRFQSEHWLNTLGYQKDEFSVGNTWYSLVHPKDLTYVTDKIEEHVKNHTPFYECDYRVKNKNGSYTWVKERGKALFDKKGIAYRIAGSHTDVTEIKNYEETLEFIAYSDPLTCLPNRRYLEEIIAKDFQKEELLGVEKALVYLDVDNFKLVNDTLGHYLGDKVIVALGCRLSQLVSDKIILLRLGGDELIYYLYNYGGKKALEAFVIAIKEELKEPIDIDGNIVHINISIGIAMYPEHGAEIEDLLKKADIAMYKAKEEGKNAYRFFDKVYSDDMKKLVKIEALMRKGIENQEFLLYYQPKVDAVALEVVGFEALVRWQNNEMGFVPPCEFIDVAEYTGLIIPIGNWVVREACAFIKKINEEKNGKDKLVSVNVSAVQLMQENFKQTVLECIEECDIDPRWLELEITETVLIKSPEKVVQALQDLRSHGIKIALDDFGKEYSSLSYLKNLPIDVLKIDKIFIDDINKNNNKDTIVDIVVALGQKMGLDIIAEGVETEDQLEYLIKNNCKNIQGYIFSRPIAATEVREVVNRINNMER